MQMKRTFQVLLVTALALITGVMVLIAQTEEVESYGIRVDVAEDGGRFTFDPSITHEDGMPAFGTTFVTQGYIYPEGTLNGSNGVLEDGSPEFPELVLGEWTCYGTFVGDGMYTETGEVVITTQIFSFYGVDDDVSTIVSTGYELIDTGVFVERAITGGTGEYAFFDGVQTQQLLGFTEQMGVNLRVELSNLD